MTEAKAYDNSYYLEGVVNSAFYYQCNALAYSEGLWAASCNMTITDHSYGDEEFFEALQHWLAGYLTIKPTAAFDLGVAAGEAKVAGNDKEIANPFFCDTGIGAQAWTDGFAQASQKNA